jgi:hypothetical protein
VKAKVKKDTQGARANDSGEAFEAGFEASLKRKGFRKLARVEVDNLCAGASPHDIEGAWYATQISPYANIYTAQFKADFLFSPGDGVVLVEMKWQATPGSVDEKYPFAVLTLKRVAVERGLRAVLVLAGGGARNVAVRWCREQQDENLLVLAGADELQRWVNADFPQVLNTKRVRSGLLE